MNAVVRLMLRDARVLNRGLVALQLILPLFFLFVASFPLTSLIAPFQVGGQAISYQRFLATGLIAQTTMTGSLIGGTLLFTDRRHGMFGQILVGPATRADYATSKMLSSAAIGLSGAVVVAAFGLPFTYGVHPTLPGAALALGAVLAGAFFFAGLSVILASVFRSLEAFEGTFNLLLILLTFVSSSLYPLSAVPSGLRGLMLLNPLTYDVDLLRMGILGFGSPYAPWEALALSVECVLVFVGAVAALRRTARLEAA
ncbi:MAG: ABC transporter permease [Nitrososphaerota archaeon]|nr:ABC transporter permease [Nitrososphaerota archaeon]MDG7020990.1 ABC transporter permease [Nitrososphaerota archaeon]MDG7022317.1 ABC transporter permease [Nitrososphaerota archaeon]